MNSILNSFLATLLGAYANLMAEARWLLGTFITFEILFFGMWWALGADNRVVEGLKKILKFGFWIWLVLNFPTVIQWIVDSFITAGFRAVGYSGSTNILMNPGAIMDQYFLSAQPIVEAIENLSWYDVGSLSLFGLSLIGLLISYLIMSAQVFLITLEFYLIAAVSIILLPFGVFKPTSFLGEKAIGAIISFGIKFMVLSLLLGLITPVLSTLVPVAEADGMHIRPAIEVMASTALLAFLVWNAPGIAAGLLAGSPSLSAGTAAQNAFAGSIMMGMGAQTIVNATRAATSFVSNTAATGTRAVGNIRTGAQIAYHTSQMGGASRAASLVAGVSGGARAAGSSLVRSAVGASNSISQAASRNMRIGGRSGWQGTGGTLSGGMQGANASDLKSGSTSQGSSPPSWYGKTMHALHAAPREARPSGGSSGFKI